MYRVDPSGEIGGMCVRIGLNSKASSVSKKNNLMTIPLYHEGSEL